MELFTQNKIVMFAASIILTAAVGFLDWGTGYKMHITIFYIIPICLASWYIGMFSGLFISLLCSITMLEASLLAGSGYSTFIIVWNLIIDFMTFSVISVALWKLKNTLEMSNMQAKTDFLTNILNIRAFYEEGSLAITKCMKKNLPLAMVFIDCDNFKRVNDEEGHEVGDQVLKVVAHTIQMNLKKVDKVSRFGGDEFLIMVIGSTDDNIQNTVSRVNEKLMTAMEERNWPVTFSVGVAIFNTPPSSIYEAVKVADNLMYQVKSEGKNGIRYRIIN